MRFKKKHEEIEVVVGNIYHLKNFTMSFFKIALIALAAAFAAFQMATCATTECSSDRLASINEIRQASSELDKSAIVVGGKVTTTISTPMLKYYTIEDDTGEAIMVKIAKGGFVPMRGAFVMICAEVRELYSINGEVKSVVLIELNRTDMETKEELDHMSERISVMHGMKTEKNF